ncbi:MAG: flagellar basal body rod protein FlgB [Lachnospiraceae bacterium]|nr:flagellar basal body rod protein FlgB [Lachnospiraceae bacterium]
MISSSAFSYINILDKAADASWTRESLIANNIANVDTPGYKRQDIDFQSALKNELGRYKYTSLDAKVERADLRRLNPEIYTDAPGYSYRLDENNVDIDTEQVELASEQIKYQALTTSITSEFERIRTVLR